MNDSFRLTNISMIEFYIEGDDGKTVVSGADGPVVA